MNCCPFARSGGLHGEDCTYSGKSHCPYRMAAEGLQAVASDYLQTIEIERQAERRARVKQLNDALAWASQQRATAERKVQKVKDILASDAFIDQTLILIRDVVYK